MSSVYEVLYLHEGFIISFEKTYYQHLATNDTARYHFNGDKLLLEAEVGQEVKLAYHAMFCSEVLQRLHET